MSDLNSVPDYVWYNDGRMLQAMQNDREPDRGGPTIEEIRGYKPREDSDPGWLIGLSIALLVMTVIALAAILIGANRGI